MEGSKLVCAGLQGGAKTRAGILFAEKLSRRLRQGKGCSAFLYEMNPQEREPRCRLQGGEKKQKKKKTKKKKP